MQGAQDAGSFRDPRGHVFEQDGDIVRTVRAGAVDDYDAVARSGLFDELTGRGWLVGTSEADAAPYRRQDESVVRLLRHERIPFVSYPYEWSFFGLKAAALLHLDIQIAALAKGVALSDASAYNIQFRGAEPVFIDVLSFRPYRDGEVWLGHRQFCEQFLNPLLVNALLGLPHQGWFRGQLEGVPTRDLARLLKWRHRLSWNVLTQVVMQAKLDARAIAAEQAATDDAKKVRLSKTAFHGMLTMLRNWIARLEPAAADKTVWSDYTRTHTYASDEERQKQDAVAAICRRLKPRMVYDLGCNTGAYAALALAAGAEMVIGFEADHGALEQAFLRARNDKLAFLPLFQDLANPSPAQGWRQAERKGLGERAGADFVMALAVEHHLAIGRNIPLPAVVAEIVSQGRGGVIEFVEKNDSTVQRMLKLREDIFPDYTLTAFRDALASVARIESEQRVSEEGRTLFHFSRA